MLKKSFIKILICFLFVVISSCTLEPFDSQKEIIENQVQEEVEETVVEKVSELFTTEIDDRTFVFETNDSKYLKKTGYTIWTTNKTNISSSFETINCEMYKSSGKTEAGYGVVFCQQKINTEDYMLCVMINTVGQYIIGNVVDAKFQKIEGWKDCSYLNKGYGVKNQLCITYDEKTQYFTININGKYVTKFKVMDDIKFEKTKIGYVVVISNLEKFPQKEVRVVFKEVE